MSTTIDERVVEMRFDNKQFEQNVQTSISTIEKLEKSLNLKGASKGLEDVNAAAKNCNMTPLSNAVETVRCGSQRWKSWQLRLWQTSQIQR